MTQTSLVRSLVVVALFAGCAVESDSPEPTAEPIQVHGDFEQLVKVTTYTGTTVEIVAAGKGFMAVELGDKDLPRALDGIDGMTLADVYRVATLQEPPARIEALSTQFAVAPTNPNAAPPTRRYAQSTPDVVAPQQLATAGSCSASWMQSQGFCNTGPGTDWALLNWWNGAYEHLNGVFHANSWLCADIGDIVWEIHNGDGGNHTWTVLQGQLASYWLSSGDWWGTWLNFDVTHASNNRFHFCGWASIP